MNLNDNIPDLGLLGKAKQVQGIACPHPDCEAILPIEFSPDIPGVMSMMSAQLHMTGHVLTILTKAVIHQEQINKERAASTPNLRNKTPRKSGR